MAAPDHAVTPAWPAADAAALDNIKDVWEGIYDAGYADGAYRAVRTLGGGPLLTASTIEGIESAIRADWARWGSEQR